MRRRLVGFQMPTHGGFIIGVFTPWILPASLPPFFAYYLSCHVILTLARARPHNPHVHA